MKSYRNPVEKFAKAVADAGPDEVQLRLMVDLLALPAERRTTGALRSECQWRSVPMYQALSWWEDRCFLFSTAQGIEIDWKALNLDLLEADLSPRKPLSATLTLQTTFRRLQEPSSKAHAPSKKHHLATFRRVSQVLTKNRAENQAEELMKAYFKLIERSTTGIASPESFLAWLLRRFTAKP